MGMFAMFSQLFSGFGLSSAAGLNAYVPLLAVGIMARLGYVHLTGPYAILASTGALVVIAILAAVDFVADKVPAVDHAAHAIGAIVNPVAGAIVFGSQTHALTGVPPVVALGAGLIIAGGFHATRAAIRPVATTTTAGMANPILSIVEDIASTCLSLLAIFLPFVAFLVFLVMIVLAIKSWGMIRRGFNRLFGRRNSQPVA